jgi:hypothetical protein
MDIVLDGYVFEFNHPNRDGSMVEFSCVFWFKKNNVNVSKIKKAETEQKDY